MSHERSITIQTDKKHYIIPTVQRGRPMTKEQAVKKFMAGKLRPLGNKRGYSTQKEAIAAAKRRSSKSSPKKKKK